MRNLRSILTTLLSRGLVLAQGERSEKEMTDLENGVKRNIQNAFNRMAWLHLWLMVAAVLLLTICAVSLVILVRVNSVQEALDVINKRIATVEQKLNTDNTKK